MSAEIEATAADSGAKATERFRSDKSSVLAVSADRVSQRRFGLTPLRPPQSCCRARSLLDWEQPR